jgi:hypothetical protein
MTDLINKPKAPGGIATPTAPTPPVIRENKREDPVTNFIGTEDKISFVTGNAGRTTANSLQADFVEVGYALKDCKNLTDQTKTSKCLWRRIQSIVDDKVDEGGTESVLLENVSEFKLRYFGEGKQDFVSNWRTTDNDGATKGRYPEVVEVTLSIVREIDKKKRTYLMQFKVPIHFPNNPPPAAGTPNMNGPGGSPMPPAGGGGI